MTGKFRLKRIAVGSVALIIVTIMVCVLTNPTPLAATVSEGDCVEIQVSDNGWHTNFYLPASAFPADHPFRTDYPGANWFVVGWGDEGFYIKGPSILRGFDAIIPPSPTVVHLIALDRPPEDYFSDRRLPYSLSSEGLDQLVSEIDASLKMTRNGELKVVSEGHYPGASRFYRSRFSYHAFHTCNQWTAGVLRKAGAPINAPASMLSGSLMMQLENTHKACPVPQKPDTIEP
ncbi:MAG: hypothetical protein CMK09_02420 [Ponticaulis sp.]|nr:hypothetical protein [Ponticaulis sp.]|tara:strand:- start:20194 stop:20889 length:696 start_codon:yes stop_codon:yes gene_type:complete